MKDKKPTVKIRNVSFIGKQMIGEVYGHPRFEDGTEVRTSTIKEIVTKNTRYIIEES